MKCPLLAMGAVAISSTVEAAESDCLKEECAWWYARNQTCVALSIADRLLDLALALFALKEKMRLEKQSRK